MRDMNAKVGKDMRDHNIGRYSLHEVSNGNGMRLIDFAVNRNMVISSVRFPHKDIHKETWITPNGHTENQIDHVLIDVRHASDIVDVKSCRGADCDSDHYLVKIKYRPRLSTASRSTGTRNVKFNMDRIKERTVRDKYRQILDQQLDSKSSQNNDDIEEKWMNIKQSIHKAAEETLGTIQPKKRNGWFDQDCQIALDTRNEARKRMLQRGTRANMLEYADARKAAKAICRRKKNEYEENICHELQDRYSRN
jgi:hypothetical protein